MELFNFRVTPNSDTVGIIQAIQTITNQEVVPKTIIALNTSSYDNEHPPEDIYQKIQDPNNIQIYFRTAEYEKENQWISIDFREEQVNPTHFMARFIEKDLFPCFQIYGTRNGCDEQLIDTININISDHPPGNNLGATSEWFIFPIQSKKAYNNIRIVGEGKRLGYNNTRLVFHKLDFYGTYISSYIQTKQYNSIQFTVIQTISLFAIFLVVK